MEEKKKSKLMIIIISIVVIIGVVVGILVNNTKKVPTQKEISGILWLNTDNKNKFYTYNFGTDGECSYMTSNSSGEVIDKQDGTYEIKKNGIYIKYNNSQEHKLTYEYNKEDNLILKDGSIILEDRTDILRK